MEKSKLFGVVLGLSKASVSPLLFQPAALYMMDLLKKAGIAALLATDLEELQQSEADRWVRPEDLPEVLNTEDCQQVLLLAGNLPMLTLNTLAYALEVHGDSHLAATRISNHADNLCMGLILHYNTLASALQAGIPLSLSDLSVYSRDLPSNNRVTADHPHAALAAGTPAANLKLSRLLMEERILPRLLENGVEILSGDGVLIHPRAKIGAGTAIYPGTILKENVLVGEHCVLGPNTLIQNSSVGAYTKINASQVYASRIGSQVDIGPFAHIRPDSVIEDHVHIGDFVEIKNSRLGEYTGVSHLTYIGDSQVGRGVNFGCGCVTVNYSGSSKAACIVEDNAFVGCNTNLVAPVHVGQGAYIAAGSTITDDVPDDALAIARARQVTKEGRGAGRFAKKAPAKPE